MNQNMRSSIVFLIFFFLFVGITYAQKRATIKVLAIGNSFSEDAVETYFSELAEADSVEVVIGSLVIGGCSLERHWNNAVKNDSSYRYTKIDWKNNVRIIQEKQTLANGIIDEDWDYITFQQVSHDSGIYDSYFPYLKNLFEYVKSKAVNVDVKYAIHMTWAYDKEATHYGFVKYNNDQQKMYNAILEAIPCVAKNIGIEIIIPSGVAIQNFRALNSNSKLCRDGFHLSVLGQFIASCVWYEVLTGNSVIGNTFIPKGITPKQCREVQGAVQNVLLRYHW